MLHAVDKVQKGLLHNRIQGLRDDKAAVAN